MLAPCPDHNQDRQRRRSTGGSQSCAGSYATAALPACLPASACQPVLCLPHLEHLEPVLLEHVAHGLHRRHAGRAGGASVPSSAGGHGAAAHEEADATDQQPEQEGHPPAPLEQLRLGQEVVHHRRQRRAQEDAHLQTQPNEAHTGGVFRPEVRVGWWSAMSR